MDVVKANDIAAILTSVAAYGGQLAAVFHHYAIIAEKIPSGFEGAINILDATVAVIKQVLSLVKDEAEGKKLFNQDGLTYVQLLAQECANTLAKVEPIIAEACLERKDRKAKRKQSKKAASKKLVTEIDALALKLDEKDFLENVETTRWTWASDDIEKCMERLYDLQLHLLLIFEVVKVGSLSKDLTFGKVDVQSIVSYHDRIKRTANLVGIKAPKNRSFNRRRISISSSDSDSSSNTGSDSDASSIVPKKKKFPFMCGPPPPRPGFYGGSGAPPGAPPPPNPVGSGAPPGPPPPPVMVTLPPPKAQNSEVIIIDETSINNAKPPAYSEVKLGNTAGLVAPLPTMPQTKSEVSSKVAAERTVQPVHSDEKAEDEPAKVEEIAKPAAPEGRLFKSPSNVLVFKIKSFFRSKESLAAEMRRTLSDSESHLMAYVVQRHDLRQVPHSAFHTLEATHMKTILSQLNGSEWYKTFNSLDTYEHALISRLLHPWMNGKVYERELVVLKVLEQNRLSAWMALLGELLRNRPFPYLANGRVLLAIVREKFVDGKPLKEARPPMGHPPPPPPPPPFPAAPIIPSIRPPPMPYSPPRRTTISDLNGPPPPRSNWPVLCGAGLPPGPPGGPPRPASNFSSCPPPPPRNSSTRTCDSTPVTDSDATAALTTYNEYTIRLVGKPGDTTPRTWSRVAITQENSEKHLLLQRIEQFKRGGGNVIEAKLRLTELQSGQVSRLMDDLQCYERDSRFEWTWAEISLYNDTGEITEFLRRGVVKHDLEITGSANRMHLIANRSLKASYKALDVYNALMKPPPPPRPPVSNPPAIIDLTPARPAAKKSKYVSSSGESDSDSSYYNSDSTVGNVRRRLRTYRAKKWRKSGKGRRFYNGSDSDSDDSEDEDVIAVNVTLKRGDDIVKVLLDRWTPDGLVVGKGKGRAVA